MHFTVYVRFNIQFPGRKHVSDGPIARILIKRDDIMVKLHQTALIYNVDVFGAMYYQHGLIHYVIA